MRANEARDEPLADPKRRNEDGGGAAPVRSSRGRADAGATARPSHPPPSSSVSDGPAESGGGAPPSPPGALTPQPRPGGARGRAAATLHTPMYPDMHHRTVQGTASPPCGAGLEPGAARSAPAPHSRSPAPTATHTQPPAAPPPAAPPAPAPAAPPCPEPPWRSRLGPPGPGRPPEPPPPPRALRQGRGRARPLSWCAPRALGLSSPPRGGGDRRC